MAFPQLLRALTTSSLSAIAVCLIIGGGGCMKDKSGDMSSGGSSMSTKAGDSMASDKATQARSGTPMVEKTLYDRLGGEPALTAVVEDFVGRAASDDKVNFFRKGTSMEWKPGPAEVAAFKKSLVQFLAGATGGPKNYAGKDMKSAHAGMQITHEEFMALAGDLSASLDKFNVPAKEKGELMAIAASTHDAIVEKK